MLGPLDPEQCQVLGEGSALRAPSCTGATRGSASPRRSVVSPLSPGQRESALESALESGRSRSLSLLCP